MNAPKEAFPLAWPQGRPRTRMRERARFGTGGSNGGRQALTVYVGLSRLIAEMERLGAQQVVITSNLPRRLDGLPRSGARAPEDPGIAVYFSLRGKPHVLACDKWDTCADNLAAIAADVEALRGRERWGVSSLEQAFAGHLALPPMEAKKPWWAWLGLAAPPTKLETAEAAWAKRIYKEHPDRGGNANTAAELNAAMTEARAFYKAESEAATSIGQA